MEIYEVTLIELKTKNEISLFIEVDEAETSENFEIKAVIDGQTVQSTNYNYLPAFQQFRDKLLLLGYGIKCNGSRINSVQSCMMEATDKVYLVEMGKKALLKDVVRIFDYADIDNFPDTNEQMAFFEKWIKR